MDNVGKFMTRIFLKGELLSIKCRNKVLLVNQVTIQVVSDNCEAINED